MKRTLAIGICVGVIITLSTVIGRASEATTPAAGPVGALIDSPDKACVAGSCTSHKPVAFGHKASVSFNTTRTFSNGDKYKLQGSVGISENSNGSSLPGSLTLTITFEKGHGSGNTSKGNDAFELDYYLDYTSNGENDDLTATASGSFSSGVAPKSTVEVSVVYCGKTHSQTLGPISNPPNTFNESTNTFFTACPKQTLVDTRYKITFKKGTKPGAVIKLGNPTPSHDLDGDIVSDILWRDRTSGELALWLMNGTQISQQGHPGSMPNGWSVVGQRDFDGDGKADILWRNTADDLQMWFMDGLKVASTASVGKAPTNATLYGTADLNGDGKGDLLWRDGQTGVVTAWFMNGSRIIGTATLGSMPSNWSIVGSDARGDIFWRDASGAVQMWQVSGSKVAANVSLGNMSTNWSLAGVGDFDGDGDIDLLWADGNTGTLQLWLMNGTQVQSKTNLEGIKGKGKIVQTGDYNGDGVSDVLWSDGSGNVEVWYMNDTQTPSIAFFTIGANWFAQSANAE